MSSAPTPHADGEPDRECDWEGARRAHLRRMRALSFDELLDWLERTNALTRELLGDEAIERGRERRRARWLSASPSWARRHWQRAAGSAVA
jgi:hypothetical protein